VLRNGSQISLKGADKSPDNLRGVGLDFLLLDEYADIPVEAWTEVLRPTISDKHVTGNVLFIGTPRGYGNWSYDIYQKGLGSDAEWKSCDRIRYLFLVALCFPYKPVSLTNL